MPYGCLAAIALKGSIHALQGAPAKTFYQTHVLRKFLNMS
jgi:hypothetical protein